VINDFSTAKKKLWNKEFSTVKNNSKIMFRMLGINEVSTVKNNSKLYVKCMATIIAFMSRLLDANKAKYY
jgi:hypothetical protein